MNKKALDYLNNLEDQKLNRKKGIITEGQITRGQWVVRNVAIFRIGNNLYYGKPYDNTGRSIQEKAAREMYSDLGIPTPQISFAKIERGNIPDLLHTISPDLNQLPVYTAVPASQVFRTLFEDMPRYTTDKWSLLKNNKVREKFLSVITSECLAQIIDMYLLDETRTEYDRWFNNYFLYKLPNEDKYTGIIPIDMDSTEIMHCPPTTANKFKQFIYRSYSSYTPTEQEELSCLSDRIDTLRDKIEDGALSDRHIMKLKHAIDYGFADKIKQTCMEHGMKEHLKDTYDPHARLEEYLQDTIGRDLENY